MRAGRSCPGETAIKSSSVPASPTTLRRTRECRCPLPKPPASLLPLHPVDARRPLQTTTADCRSRLRARDARTQNTKTPGRPTRLPAPTQPQPVRSAQLGSVRPALYRIKLPFRLPANRRTSRNTRFNVPERTIVIRICNLSRPNGSAVRRPAVIVAGVWLQLSCRLHGRHHPLVETPNSEMHDVGRRRQDARRGVGAMLTTVAVGFITARVSTSFTQRLRSCSSAA